MQVRIAGERLQGDLVLLRRRRLAMSAPREWGACADRVALRIAAVSASTACLRGGGVREQPEVDGAERAAGRAAPPPSAGRRGSGSARAPRSRAPPASRRASRRCPAPCRRCASGRPAASSASIAIRRVKLGARCTTSGTCSSFTNGSASSAAQTNWSRSTSVPSPASTDGCFTNTRSRWPAASRRVRARALVHRQLEVDLRVQPPELAEDPRQLGDRQVVGGAEPQPPAGRGGAEVRLGVGVRAEDRVREPRERLARTRSAARRGSPG